MDPFQHLPPELVHQVLKSFNFHELSVLHRVAPSWDGFLKSIEEVLLREKAVNELGKGKGNKVPCDMPDPEGKESGKGDHKSWKEICQCALETKHNKKECIVTCDWIQTRDKQAWKIKIDPVNRVMYSTNCRREILLGDDPFPEDGPGGGLHVTHLDTKEHMQCIQDVPELAHVEYDAGYVVASGADGLRVYRNKEAKLPPGLFVPTGTDPNGIAAFFRRLIEQGITICAEEIRKLPRIPSGGKGNVLVAHGVIYPPFEYRALRLRGTTLMLASRDHVMFYDVVHMRLISVKEIRHTGSAGKLVDVIKYIEFDDDYMFICASFMHEEESDNGSGMSVWHRSEPFLAPSNRLCIIDTQKRNETNLELFVKPGMVKPYLFRNAILPGEDTEKKNKTRMKGQRLVCDDAGSEPVWRESFRGAGQFREAVDVEVSACHFGSQHLFVLGTCGRAYILPQYKRELDQLYQKHQAGNSAGNDLAQNVIALYFGDAEGETTLAPVWDNTCLAIQNDLAVFTLSSPFATAGEHQMLLLDLKTVPDIRQTGRDNLKQLELFKMPDMRVDDLEFCHGIEVTDEGIYFPVGVRDYEHQDEDRVEQHNADSLSPWEMPADPEMDGLDYVIVKVYRFREH